MISILRAPRSRRAPRRVLLAVEGLGISGKTKALTDLACGLDPDRWRPEVVCLRREDSPLAGTLERAGVPVHEVPFEDGLDPRNVWRLVGRLRETGPDVVHCFNPRMMLHGGLAAHLLGIWSTVGSLSAFACQSPERDYDFLPQPLNTATRRNRYRNRVAVALMRRLAVVSRGLGEQFFRFNGMPARKMRVIGYGVSVPDLDDAAADPERAAVRRELRLGPEDVVACSVGRLVEQKDYPTQLCGFAAAVRREPRLTMLLAGDGPLRPALEQTVRDLGVDDRVRFLGHRADVPRLLRGIDIYVITSRFEPYGVAVLEAKAAACAIVATSVNEMPEILSRGASGVLVPPRDPERLADALVTLARDAALRGRLARRAHREARDRHSLRVTVDRYQALYDELRGGMGALTPVPG